MAKTNNNVRREERTTTRRRNPWLVALVAILVVALVGTSIISLSLVGALKGAKATAYAAKATPNSNIDTSNDLYDVNGWQLSDVETAAYANDVVAGYTCPSCGKYIDSEALEASGFYTARKTALESAGFNNITVDQTITGNTITASDSAQVALGTVNIAIGGADVTPHGWSDMQCNCDNHISIGVLQGANFRDMFNAYYGELRETVREESGNTPVVKDETPAKDETPETTPVPETTPSTDPTPKPDVTPKPEVTPDPTPDPTPEVKKTVNAHNITLYVGETKSLTFDSNFVGNASWTSNGSYANVTSNGTVIGVQAGQQVAKVTVDGISDTCIITVLKKEVNQQVTADDLTIYVGDEDYLDATANPDGEMTWTSNGSYAKVYSDGRVKGLKPGTQVAKVVVNGVYDTCLITVLEKEEKQTVVANDLTLYEGETKELSAAANPSGKLVWASTGENATVTATGTVTGVKAGKQTAKVTVNGVSDSCTITVLAKPVEQKVVAEDLTLYVGETKSLVATATPDGAKVWTSNGENANVTSEGSVTGIKAGTQQATVTVNGASASCTITVLDVPVEQKVVAEDLTLYVGETKSLVATATPDGAKVWTSNGENANVTSEGSVTGIKAGTQQATVTVGNATATCTITVLDVAVEQKVTANDLTVYVGETGQLTGTATPEGTIVWSSEGSNASVSATGEVVGLVAGTQTATATVNGVSSSCTITVLEKEAPKNPPVLKMLPLEGLSIPEYTSYSFSVAVAVVSDYEVNVSNVVLESINHATCGCLSIGPAEEIGNNTYMFTVTVDGTHFGEFQFRANATIDGGSYSTSVMSTVIENSDVAEIPTAEAEVAASEVPVETVEETVEPETVNETTEAEVETPSEEVAPMAEEVTEAPAEETTEAASE